MYPEKFQIDQIQNGPLATIIDFNMRNIWKNTCQIARPCGMTIKQNIADFKRDMPWKILTQ